MAPDDRRASLIAATVPLLHECGLDVSTRQIARAAGVAEGTIFGVFPDKGSLVVAALMHALDPRPTVDAIAAIDPGAGLRDRLARAATLINERFSANAHLMAGARRLLFASDAHPDAAARMAEGRERLHSALAALIEPDAALLRRPPGTVARLLLLFCGANSFGPFGDPARFDGDEMVSLLLDGLLVTHRTDRRGDDRC
ncbi:TetR family transcriptional regulator [Couchioplanes caeruleus]|uniref:TetR family transcriptional regulator n=3 Tax=Couchioplanes caeruleus TaxID=56438 RepID=A0A1K0GDF0_9ACTN|nr:TetR family transcriptional regulator [Couchioplanes caeruleus subsp. caeruleus]ROP32897.1 TetR family transcriptional regulator [Couchioplanes caeruleus]